MKARNALLASVVAAALSLPFTSIAQDGPAANPKSEGEKRYVVVKPEKKDSRTSNSSGTPKRLVGRSLEPKSAWIMGGSTWPQ